MDGWSVSEADLKLFSRIKSRPDPSLYPHTHRWYIHIKRLCQKKRQASILRLFNQRLSQQAMQPMTFTTNVPNAPTAIKASTSSRGAQLISLEIVMDSKSSESKRRAALLLWKQIRSCDLTPARLEWGEGFTIATSRTKCETIIRTTVVIGHASSSVVSVTNGILENFPNQVKSVRVVSTILL